MFHTERGSGQGIRVPGLGCGGGKWPPNPRSPAQGVVHHWHLMFLTPWTEYEPLLMLKMVVDIILQLRLVYGVSKKIHSKLKKKTKQKPDVEKHQQLKTDRGNGQDSRPDRFHTFQNKVLLPLTSPSGRDRGSNCSNKLLTALGEQLSVCWVTGLELGINCL